MFLQIKQCNVRIRKYLDLFRFQKLPLSSIQKKRNAHFIYKIAVHNFIFQDFFQKMWKKIKTFLFQIKNTFINIDIICNVEHQHNFEIAFLSYRLIICNVLKIVFNYKIINLATFFIILLCCYIFKLTWNGTFA